MLRSAHLQGRGKKDAKQLAAAVLLEELLGTVDSAEFLMPSKQPKHLPMRVRLRAAPLQARPPGRRLLLWPQSRAVQRSCCWQHGGMTGPARCCQAGAMC